MFVSKHSRLTADIRYKLFKSKFKSFKLLSVKDISYEIAQSFSYSQTPSSFEFMIYNDISLKNKSQFVINEYDSCANDKTCLSWCNSVSGCVYAYFYSSSYCLLCSVQAEAHLKPIKGSSFLYKKRM